MPIFIAKGEIMKKLLGKTLGLLALSLAITACGAKKDEKPATETKTEISASHPKDELILGIGSEPEKGFDPIHEASHSSSLIFHSSLLKRDLDLNIVNDLADAYKISDDKLTYTVTLKDDLKFSDGSPLTADDVIFSYTKAKEENTAGINLTRFVKAEKVDDKALNLILEKPDISFTTTMASLGIVSKDKYKAGYGENPLGSGPFKLVEWKKGQEMIVEPNQYYYGDAVPFKKVTFIFFKDDDTALATAKEGLCDIIRIPYTAKMASILQALLLA